MTIRVASRGDKKQLMDRANENASQALQRSKMSRISDMGARTQAMNDVAKALGLAEAPLRIECYDISNTVGGAFQVASMVVFEDAIAKKSEYRRFAIRGKDGKGAVDDLSALYETLTRRFKHGNIAGDSGESIDAEQRVASAAGKMTTAVAAETIAANGNDNGEGGSDISGKARGAGRSAERCAGVPARHRPAEHKPASLCLQAEPGGGRWRQAAGHGRRQGA